MSFLQKPLSLAEGDFALPLHDQRRTQLRLRSVRAQDHARAARNARPEPLVPGVQRGRAGAGRNDRPVHQDVRALRLPPRGVLSLLRHGRGDADRLRRIQGGPAGGAHVRRRSPGKQPGGRRPGRRRGRPRAGRQRRQTARPADCHCSSRKHDEAGARPGRRDLGQRPQRGAGLLEPPGRNRAHVPRLPERHRRRARSCGPATWASCRTASCSSPAGSKT